MGSAVAATVKDQYKAAKRRLRHHGTSVVTARGNSALASPP
jgi:hypothetical protein